MEIATWFLVAIAAGQFAWTIYQDLKGNGKDHKE